MMLRSPRDRDIALLKPEVQMTPPATTHANQQRRFKKSDLAIFLGFPLVLLGGFLLFVHLKRNSADPNLRLVAQVSEDISVELVAVAHQFDQKHAARKWWKPNGLPAPGIKDNPTVTTPQSNATGFYFLYKYNDDRSGKVAVVGGTSGPTMPGDDKKNVVVMTTAKPDFWQTVQTGVRISTEGVQYIGELTPEHRKFSTSVGGLFATVEVLSGHELNRVPGFHTSPCVLLISEPLWKSTSSCEVKVFDETGKEDTSVSPRFGWTNDQFLYFLHFNSATWSKIVIHRTVFDVIVTFDGIASQPDSITSPRVGNISRLKDKRVTRRPL